MNLPIMKLEDTPEWAIDKTSGLLKLDLAIIVVLVLWALILKVSQAVTLWPQPVFTVVILG